MTIFNKTALVFIDSAVQEYEILAHNIQPEIDVIVLENNHDVVEQIATTLAQYDRLESLHIVSHGQAGALQLGQTHLNLDNLDQYKHSLQMWASALSDQANLLLYGCEVAQGDRGQQFVRRLSELTQVAVAASENLTGSAASGGDWNLEFATGEIHAPLAFQPEAMASYGHTLATVLLDESFRNDDVSDNTAWIFGAGSGANNPFLTARNTTAPSDGNGVAAGGGLPGAPSGFTTETDGDGALRLTDNSNNQAAFVIYNRPIPSSNGLSITFDFFAYNGSGADGISFFLIDANEPTVTAGAFGGSLGYAQRNSPVTVTGIEGGYIGIGLDEFGNYSNPTEGRQGGPGARADAIAIRGSETSGSNPADPATGYIYLTGTNSLAGGLDNPTATSRNAAGTKRTAKIDIVPTATTATINIKVDLNGDGDFLDPDEAPIELTNYTISTTNGALPANFKFGFASSTGGSTNIHEIRNLRISDARPGVSFSGTGVTVGSDGVPRLTTTEGGGPVTVSVALNTRPSSNVTLNLVNTDPTEGTVSPTTLTFTPANWDSLQTVTIAPVEDAIADGPIAYSFTTRFTTTDPTYAALNPPDIGVTNNDNESGQNGGGVSDEETDNNCRPGRRIRGTAGADRLRGGRNSDRLVGLNGNDVLDGRRCNDRLTSGNGNDRLLGQSGQDTLLGGNGNDLLQGGRGSDRLNGGRGEDTLRGDSGSDRMRGGSGRDSLFGGLGNDVMNGGLDRDRVRGGDGDDVLNGFWGNDFVGGGNGNDLVLGRLGNDQLFGGAGHDTLVGGGGNDQLFGSTGADVITGGRGRDRITYRSLAERGDTITDFAVTRDRIDLRAFAQGASSFVNFVQSGANTVIQVNTGSGFQNYITLNNVTVTALNSRNVLV
jgi:hypothetical protein